jgi:peptidoglycan DL-endopeptidase CwlO
MSRKHHVKHLPAAAVSVVATLSLAACGSSSPSKTTGSHTTAASVATTQSSSSSPEAVSSSTTASQTSATATQSNASATARGARQADISLINCLEQHGVHLPPQNTAARHPTFNSKGVNTSSHVFKNCLRIAFTTFQAVQESASHSAG